MALEGNVVVYENPDLDPDRTELGHSGSADLVPELKQAIADFKASEDAGQPADSVPDRESTPVQSQVTPPRTGLRRRSSSNASGSSLVMVAGLLLARLSVTDLETSGKVDPVPTAVAASILPKTDLMEDATVAARNQLRIKVPYAQPACATVQTSNYEASLPKPDPVIYKIGYKEDGTCDLPNAEDCRELKIETHIDSALVSLPNGQSVVCWTTHAGLTHSAY